MQSLTSLTQVALATMLLTWIAIPQSNAQSTSRAFRKSLISYAACRRYSLGA
jgi:hypothetical protein